ncbi:MAG: aldo/keto reductase [Lachnospiraceae bacterium]|nr:aldo/keto reductase [Lachnospiraceae bacterium]
MNYRDFGRTGEKISALGFGCMRFPEYEKNGKKYVDMDAVDEMLAEAYAQGVNYFDTAPYYCNSNSEAALGHGVKAFRDKVLLSSKFPGEVAKKPGDYRRQLESSLKNLDTDYIDFYHFWGISKDKFDHIIMAQNLLDDARKAKEEGLIRHISFSFHDDPSSIKYIIDTAEDYGVPMESMLVQYNLLDRSNEEMLAYAQSKGLGTVAMGPVGGGRLAAPTELYTKLTGKGSIPTYELAFKFVLGNPDLNCALSGMQNLDMVKQNAVLASSDTAFSKEEWETLKSAMEQLQKFSELYCTGCKYCQPCPAGIEIPKLFNMYTYHNVYGLTDHAKHMFQEYVGKGGKLKSDCLNCGFCERKCPQHLLIRQELEKVEAILDLTNKN